MMNERFFWCCSAWFGTKLWKWLCFVFTQNVGVVSRANWKACSRTWSYRRTSCWPSSRYSSVCQFAQICDEMCWCTIGKNIGQHGWQCSACFWLLTANPVWTGDLLVVHVFCQREWSCERRHFVAVFTISDFSEGFAPSAAVHLWKTPFLASGDKIFVVWNNESIGPVEKSDYQTEEGPASRLYGMKLDFDLTEVSKFGVVSISWTSGDEVNRVAARSHSLPCKWKIDALSSPCGSLSASESVGEPHFLIRCKWDANIVFALQNVAK